MKVLILLKFDYKSIGHGGPATGHIKMSFFNFRFRISVHKVLYHTNSEIQTILKFATGVVPFGARSMKGLLLLKSLKILELENKP